MSKNTKTGLSKIPKFGSRLPQPASTKIRTNPTSIHAEPSYDGVTKQHIGRRVRAADKEGVLRFVGPVHFSKGTWCGLELNSASGKNDGSINGIRYFVCPAGRGLMAPQNKVSLVVEDTVGSSESLSDDASGPYSMLFIDPKARPVNNFLLNKNNIRQTFILDQTDENITYTRLPNNRLAQNETRCLQNNPATNQTDAFGNGTYRREISEENALGNTNVCRNNAEQKEVLNITYGFVNERVKTNDLTNTFLPINKSCENLLHDSTVEVKRRRTSNPKNQKLENLLILNLNEKIDKPSSLPQLGCNYAINTPGIQPSIQKQIANSTPSRSDFRDATLLRLRLSSIGVSDNQLSNDNDSKRDSLECEESLGILTPGQIEENPSPFDGFLDCPGLPLDTTEAHSPQEQTADSRYHNRETKTPSQQSSLGLIDETLQKVDSGDSAKNVPNYDELNITYEVQDNTVINNNEDIDGKVAYSNQQTKEELHSPNVNSSTDYSFGIINDQILSNVTVITDTMNLDLPLDSIDHSKNFTIARIEQTPSPEELPLDPTPIAEMDPKTEPSKSSKASNCFITSITSITSIDTGYQGDGEMSRPASRGADNSPLTRRPLPRPQPRRHDPMTDSDFYTESDADNHEDNPLRGDRKAQVIDGTLYGVDPQAAADIYVNNRENMDSSGIFTDLENNSSSRNEDHIDAPHIPDPSPSDTSTKTISENSQSNLQEVLEKSSERKVIDKQIIKDNPKKRNAPSPGVLSPTDFSSPRHSLKQDGSLTKKYKMPRRDVPSKLKAMLETAAPEVLGKTALKKPVGRWDSVMNKISKNEQNKTNLKEVKSKVFNNVNINTTPRQNDNRKINSKPAGNQKAQNNKLLSPASVGKENVVANVKIISLIRETPLATPKSYRSNETQLKRPRSAQSNKSAEKRRVRNRLSSGSTPKINLESSIHSSLSDLSAATLPPNNKTIGSAKKRNDVQVTQVLTANKLSPRNQQQTVVENKKPTPLYTPSLKSRRNLFTSKTEKQTPSKECGRGTVKGGRTSPTTRQTQQQPQAQQARNGQIVTKTQQPRIAEGFAILLQHLVFNVGAFEAPLLRKQVEKYRREAEEIRIAYQQLEKSLNNEKIHYQQLIDSERARCRNEIERLIEEHSIELDKLTAEHAKLEKHLLTDKENSRQNLCRQHEDQLLTLKNEFKKLQQTHEESLEILREENDAISEQIEEKKLELEKRRHESNKMKEDYESREAILKEHNRKLEQQLTNLRNEYDDKIGKLREENRHLREENRRVINLQNEYDEKIVKLNDENRQLRHENRQQREENDRLLGYGDDKGIGIQEVQSLRAVLELKQNEIAALQKELGTTALKAEVLQAAEEKVRHLNARCEDFQMQLQIKSDHVASLINENSKLHESFKEESNQNRRLSRYNEELRWKLDQNKEVVAKVFEQAEETVFNRSVLSSSYNERHSFTKSNLERSLSFRDRTYNTRSSIGQEEAMRSKKSRDIDFEIDDISPPTSPKVKGVVEKSDSVSYVLDLNESPEVVASRIVRRSFRNTTPPKNTPTKSPANKRPRIRVSLSQSASSSAIISPTKNQPDRQNSTLSCASDDFFSWDNNIANSTEYNGSSDDCDASNFTMKIDDTIDLDEDNEVDIPLPALPSELNRRSSSVQALPMPKHLAGDICLISESNSEDESTSSSQL